MLAYLVQGVTLGLSAAASPGPFQAYMLSQALQKGWRRTLILALAPLLSDGPVIALVLLVLSKVPGWFLKTIQLAGGLFIIYLAWGAFKSYRAMAGEGLPPDDDRQLSLLKGALINGLGPGPWIYWSLITGPILVEGWRLSPTFGIGFLAAFYAALLSTNAGLVTLFGVAQRLGPRVARVLSGISAVALLGFGLYQLGSGITALLAA